MYHQRSSETALVMSKLPIDRDTENTGVIVMILQICSRLPEILSKYHYAL